MSSIRLACTTGIWRRNTSETALPAIIAGECEHPNGQSAGSWEDLGWPVISDGREGLLQLIWC